MTKLKVKVGDRVRIKESEREKWDSIALSWGCCQIKSTDQLFVLKTKNQHDYIEVVVDTVSTIEQSQVQWVLDGNNLRNWEESMGGFQFDWWFEHVE